MIIRGKIFAATGFWILEYQLVSVGMFISSVAICKIFTVASCHVFECVYVNSTKLLITKRATLEASAS